jgi:hypothetical protein
MSERTDRLPGWEKDSLVESLDRDVSRLNGEVDALQAELTRLRGLIRALPKGPRGSGWGMVRFTTQDEADAYAALLREAQRESPDELNARLEKMEREQKPKNTY